MADNIMVDLETRGNGAGCAILSIGACRFNPETGVVDDEFYAVVDTQSCWDAGLRDDISTMEWWSKQSPEARKVIFQAEKGDERLTLGEVLNLFDNYVAGHGADSVKIWGNGADFDNAILQACYRALDREPSWSFWNNRCYRTLKGLSPDIKVTRQGTYHNALDDARTQAVHAIDLLRKITPINQSK